MSMSRLSILALALAVVGLALSCRWPWEPLVGPVVGTVRYPSGARAAMAKVWVVEGGATFTNALGEFRLSVRGMRGDTITVVASNGYDGGMYAEKSSGSARIVLHESVIEADIVLDRVAPI